MFAQTHHVTRLAQTSVDFLMGAPISPALKPADKLGSREANAYWHPETCN